MSLQMKRTNSLVILGLLASLTGCGSIGNVFNPFYEPPTEVALLGDKNDRALQGEGGGKAEAARAALEASATYQRAMAPQPVNPVLQPAIVRLMWVPDHLNSHGDLVPAHFYYLKVLKDRWAVSDAFELQSQLGGESNASSMGYTLPEDVQ